MAHINASIRRAIGAWCALAIPLVASSMVAGARPSWTAMLLIVCLAPLAAVATLASLGTEPWTAPQIPRDRVRASR